MLHADRRGNREGGMRIEGGGAGNRDGVPISG